MSTVTCDFEVRNEKNMKDKRCAHLNVCKTNKSSYGHDYLTSKNAQIHLIIGLSNIYLSHAFDVSEVSFFQIS